MKRIFCTAALVIVITCTYVFAEDVLIDESGNMTIGTSDSAHFVVEAPSGKFAIEGYASGPGAYGVYGHNTNGAYYSFGMLGDSDYGVYAVTTDPDAWAGFFVGHVEISGDVTISNNLINGSPIGDIVQVTAGEGLTGGALAGNATLNADTTYLQKRVSSTCAAGSSIREISETGAVTCETDDIGAGDTDWTISGTDMYSGVAGNVGIGTDTPNEKLEIAGNLRLPKTDATTGIIKSDLNRLIHTYGTDNFFAGIDAGNLTMTGKENTASGSGALYSNTSGHNNTASGYYALRYNTSGALNTASGSGALYSNLTGDDNTARGSGALYYNTIGSYNTASGRGALLVNTAGHYNTASGYYALRYNTTANYNTAVGSYALNLQSYSNGGVVWESHNTAVGYKALEKNEPASTSHGIYNTAIGSQALLSNTTGYANTASGYFALSTNTAGTNNTAIGYYADVSSVALNNATAIGYNAKVNASNKVVIGSTSVTSIGGYAAWSNFSDKRVKSDIQDIGYGLDLIRQLRPVSFKMNNGNGNTDFGFVAQDIEALVGDTYNVLDIGGGDERMLSLRYTQFIAPMVKAMQEQQEQIEAQMEIIDRQQGQIDELKAMMEKLTKRI
jgi:hypothetical protein